MIEKLLKLATNPKKLIRAILGLSVAILLGWGITLHHQNKKLSESLEMAQNNIEAYQGSLQGSQQANNVLRLTVEDLQSQNDKLVQELDSVRKELNIKPKNLHTAATQTQVINVIKYKEKPDSLLEDTIKFNDLTSVSYSIYRDSIAIGLDIKNKQYLFVYGEKKYKNKKSFIKRLLTLDFKKVTTYKYKIENTNDLIQTDSVKVIEITGK